MLRKFDELQVDIKKPKNMKLRLRNPNELQDKIKKFKTTLCLDKGIPKNFKPRIRNPQNLKPRIRNTWKLQAQDKKFP